MKKILIFIVFILSLFWQTVYSQTDGKTTCANVEVFLDGVLVEGEPYELKIQGINKYDSLFLKGDGYVHIISDSNAYTLVFHGSPYYSIITVFGYKDGIEHKLLSKKIRYYPAPYQAYFMSSQVGGIYNFNYANKDDLQGAYMIADLINVINVRKPVSSFLMVYKDNEGKTRHIEGDGIIDDEMFAVIKTLPSGTALIFDNIQIDSGYGSFIEVNPFVIFLK